MIARSPGPRQKKKPGIPRGDAGTRSIPDRYGAEAGFAFSTAWTGCVEYFP